jgi:hypothetical protein
MRTQITQINGINGEPLLIDQFYTQKHGLCLDFNGEAGLTKPQVQQLVRELQNWLGETELPWLPDKGTRKQQKERAAALGLSDNEAIDIGIMSDEV